jgi:hypothetical protein
MSMGGTATISSGGWLQTASAVTAIANATSQMWQKIRFKVDTLKGLSSGTQMALTANGQLTNTSSDTWDVGFVGVTGGKYQMKMTANSNNSLTSSGNDLQSALPANGNYLVGFIFATVGGNVGCTIFDDSGNPYASVSGTFGGSLNGAGSGLISVNDCNIVGFDANAAVVYNGTAFYNSTPPTSGASRYSNPQIGDSGIIYLSWMNDSIGSSSAAAQVGTIALGDNGTVTYSGNNGSLWGPANVGLPPRQPVVQRLAPHIAALYRGSGH